MLAFQRIYIEKDCLKNIFFVTSEEDLLLFSKSTGLSEKDFINKAEIYAIFSENRIKPKDRFGDVLILDPFLPQTAQFTQNRIFIPPLPAFDLITTVNRYKRAMMERKKNILFLKFDAIPENQIFEVIKHIKKIKNKISFFIPKSRIYFSSIFIRVINFSLILTGFIFLNYNILLSFLLSLPSFFEPLQNLYIAIFFILLTDKAVKILTDPLTESPLKRLIKILSFVLYGSFFISALGTTYQYLLNQKVFHGVSVTMICAFFYSSRHTLKHLPFKGSSYIKNSLLWVLICFVFFSVIFFRNSLLNNIEFFIRERIDYLLFIRPRTREFLFGYPALSFFLFTSKNTGSFLKTLLILIATAGIIFSFNTALHFHAFLLISTLRIILGFTIGSLFGILCYFIIQKTEPKILN